MLITNFKPASIDRDKIFKTMDISRDSDNYEEYGDIFEEVSQVAFSLLVPGAAFAIRENTGLNMPGLEKCDGYSHVAYMVYTIGANIPWRITEYFNSGDYISGMMLDHIADALVGWTDKEASALFRDEVGSRGLGLTKRYTPGEQVPIDYQTVAARETNSFALLNLETSQNHMLNPVKSGSYLLWCDKSLPLLEVEDFAHDCSRCPRLDCKWRHI